MPLGSAVLSWQRAPGTQSPRTWQGRSGALPAARRPQRALGPALGQTALGETRANAAPPAWARGREEEQREAGGRQAADAERLRSENAELAAQLEAATAQRAAAAAEAGAAKRAAAAAKARAAAAAEAAGGAGAQARRPAVHVCAGKALMRWP